MSKHSRTARFFALPFCLVFCLVILRFLASAPPSPRAEQDAFELACVAFPLASRRRARSGMLAPSTRGRTWRPRLRPLGGRRPRLLAANVRRLFSPGPRSRRLPPPPSDPPPPPSDPDAGLLYLLRLAPFIVRKLQRLRVPDRDVEDIAQNVLIVAWRDWPNFDAPPDTLEGLARRRWVFTITWRCAVAYHEAGARRVVLLPNPDDPRLDPRDYDAPDVERRIDAGRALDALTEPRLATTPDRWRVFVAYELDGMQLHTIARLEGVPFGTVGTRLRLARRDLRAALFRRARSGGSSGKRTAIRRTKS